MTLLTLQRGGQMNQDQGVGREIKRLREAKGWSQTRLAAEAGMSVSGISMIENGYRNLSTTTLARLAEALGVEVRDLFPLAQAPLPDFENKKGFDVWVATLEHYKSLRSPMSNFEDLDAQERRLVFEKSLQLLLDLRTVYDRAILRFRGRDWELGLLHDVLYQAVLRMVAVYELEQERGDADAKIINIEEYKAKLKQSA
jgi:transcriptional regulator with XRE-family HTH domain